MNTAQMRGGLAASSAGFARAILGEASEGVAETPSD
jgi:hypothetical protein